MRVLLIIPAYNEEENILRVYENIQKYNRDAEATLKQKTSNSVAKTGSEKTKNSAFKSDLYLQYDLIVINDCSTDSTSKICHENNIPVIDLVHNLGIGGAVQTGFKYALENDYDVAVQFDGDGQHDVSYIEDIIKPIRDNKADLVIGSRFVKKGSSDFESSAMRRFGIKIISKFMVFATHQKIYDTTSGFRASNRAIIREFANSYPSEYPEPITDAEVIKRGYRVAEIPVSMNPRIAGTSSINSWKNAYYMINVCLSLLVIKIRRYQKCR